MEQSGALLQFIHKNAEMGKGTIPQVMEVTEDQNLRKALRSQLKEYESISDRAAQLMAQRGIEPEDTGEMREFMSGMMIKAKTLADKSSTHIAEMMIQGSTMGTIQMARRLHDCEAADEDVVTLGNKLLQTEESNIEQMKAFL